MQCLIVMAVALVCATADSADLASPGNIAGTAQVRVSSLHPGFNAAALVDGNLGSEVATTQAGTGATFRLTWDAEQTVHRVWLFDRPNRFDHVLAGKLTLSDGTVTLVGDVPNDGQSPAEVTFPGGKRISWLEFAVEASADEGASIGLSEIAVFNTPGAPATKPPPVRFERLVAVGDSITWGVGASTNSSRYSSVLTGLLRAQHPELVEVNLGRSGAALGSVEDGYANSLLAQQPSLVVVAWGVNDYYWGYSVAQFAINYENLIAGLRRAKPSLPIVVTTLVADFRYTHNVDRWIGEANVAIQEIAAKHGCYLADIHRALDHDRTFYADIIHPNDAGMRLMAETIHRALQGPVASTQKRQFSFDRGAEVRFLQHVFYADIPDEDPHWTDVTDFTKSGMTITTELPLTIRTAPVFRAKTYQIEITHAAGALVERTEVTPANSSLVLRLKPKGRQTFTVTFRPIK